MRVLFWGTPPFAVPTLRALSEEGHDVVGVVTQPDRPAGRGRSPRPSAVKTVALGEGLTVFTPDRPVGEEFSTSLRAVDPEVSVVVAYGHILPPSVLDLPEAGSINVHASLLPELRGAAPIQWAIVRGHRRTGVTVMRMVPEMDAGPILLQQEEPIGEDETATELAHRLSEVGAQTLVEALALLSVDALEEREQDHAAATYAPKIDRDTAHIRWNASSLEVSNLIRGMDEKPGAWSELNGAAIKLFRPTPGVGVEEGAEVGSAVVADPEEGLVIAAADAGVSVGEVQPPGKRRMPAADWLRGRGVAPGDRFV